MQLFQGFLTTDFGCEGKQKIQELIEGAILQIQKEARKWQQIIGREKRRL